MLSRYSKVKQSTPSDLVQDVTDTIQLQDLDVYIDYLNNNEYNRYDIDYDSNYDSEYNSEHNKKYKPIDIYRSKLASVFGTNDIDILIIYELMFGPQNNILYLNFGIALLPELVDPVKIQFLIKYLQLEGANIGVDNIVLEHETYKLKFATDIGQQITSIQRLNLICDNEIVRFINFNLPEHDVNKIMVAKSVSDILFDKSMSYRQITKLYPNFQITTNGKSPEHTYVYVTDKSHDLPHPLHHPHEHEHKHKCTKHNCRDHDHHSNNGEQKQEQEKQKVKYLSYYHGDHFTDNIELSIGGEVQYELSLTSSPHYINENIATFIIRGITPDQYYYFGIEPESPTFDHDKNVILVGDYHSKFPIAYLPFT